MKNKAMLMKKIKIADFTLEEVNLFLDTHPTDKQALMYYNKWLKVRAALVQEFNSKYGPLTIFDNIEYTDNWTWINNPWPWEYDCEVMK